MFIFEIVLKVFIAITLGDLLSGLLHWFQDCYGKKTTPIIGGFVGAGIKHHFEPRHFTKHSWWGVAKSTLPIVVILMGVLALMGQLNYVWVIAILVGWNGTEVHKWNHMSQKKRPWIANVLLRLRLIQTARHHHKHHTGLKNTYYCAVTPWLNPVLEFFRFWRGLEWIVFLFTGVRTRVDKSVMFGISRP